LSPELPQEVADLEPLPPLEQP